MFLLRNRHYIQTWIWHYKFFRQPGINTQERNAFPGYIKKINGIIVNAASPIKRFSISCADWYIIMPARVIQASGKKNTKKRQISSLLPGFFASWLFTFILSLFKGFLFLKNHKRNTMELINEKNKIIIKVIISFIFI